MARRRLHKVKIEYYYDTGPWQQQRIHDFVYCLSNEIEKKRHALQMAGCVIENIIHK